MKKLIRLLFITVAAVMLLSASGCHYLFPDGIWGDNSWDGGPTQYYTANYTPQNGYRLSVYGSCANVSVYGSSEFTTAQIEYTEPQDGKVYVNETANDINITVRNNSEFIRLFNKEKPIDVTIYLPYNIFYIIAIEVEAGNLEVKDLDGNRLDLNTDAGNITVAYSFFEGFEAHTEAGNIELEAYSLNAEISTGVGDVRGRIHTDKLDVEASVGDIILEAKGFSVNGSTLEGPSRIDIETAIGMINLLVSSDCMGDTYTIEASAVLGSEDVEPFGYGNRRIVASTSIGSISIYFK